MNMIYPVPFLVHDKLSQYYNYYFCGSSKCRELMEINICDSPLGMKEGLHTFSEID